MNNMPIVYNAFLSNKFMGLISNKMRVFLKIGYHGEIIHISNEVIDFVSNKIRMMTKNYTIKKVIHIATGMEECRKLTY